MTVKHLITDEEAADLRSLLDPATGDEERAAIRARISATGRLWQPLDAVPAMPNGRASCRSCGEPIAKGTAAIRFGFDVHGGEGWGRLAGAYLHAECPGKLPT